MIKNVFTGGIKPPLYLKSQKGFTLIELAIVIAIIGILMSIALVSLNRVQASARDATRKSDISTYKIALERFFTVNNRYPVGGGGAAPYSDVTGPAATGLFSNFSSLLVANYLPAILYDPVNSTRGADSFYYHYLTDSLGLRFILYARLEAAAANFWLNNSEGTAGLNDEEPTGL
jgi:prepilin-type N-terminal cleavage/methylation domain-containing protein